MDPRMLFSLFMLTSICMALTARAEVTSVSTWNSGCGYAVVTDHFEPPSLESMQFNLDIPGYCPD